MRRGSASGIDPGVYFRAIPLLVRNPSIIVVPLLMAVVGVLVGIVLGRSGGAVGFASSGIGGLILQLLSLFGLGVACIIADDAWRHGRASFERGWSEAQRRGGELFMAAIGVTLILAVAQFAGAIFGGLVALVFSVLVLIFLIWAIPAAAISGAPGGLAIQSSIDRVRANAPLAIVTAIVCFLVWLGLGYAAQYVSAWIAVHYGVSLIGFALIQALFDAIALSYIALVITKTFTDAAFLRRW